MRAIKDFKEFVKENIIKKQSPDKSRAEFLVEESKKSYKLLLIKIKKLKVTDQTANDFVKSCYDILMELIRAKMLLNGYNASGFKAHEAEVSYTRSLGFNERETQFLNQMRYFRNGMIYYGTILKKEDAERVIKFTKKIYKILQEIINVKKLRK